MAPLEGGGMDRQCAVHFPVFCSVVGHGTAWTSGGAERFLVAKPGRFRLSAHLRILPARFRIHLRLHVYVDSLHPKLDDRPSVEATGPSLSGLSRILGR